MVQRISSLIVKHLRSEISPAEEIELTDWVNESRQNKVLFDEITREEVLQEELTNLNASKADTWQKIEAYLATESVTPAEENKKVILVPFKRLWSFATASAVVSAVAGTFWWAMSTSRPTLPKTVVAQTADIQPGGNKAILTLEDGSSVVLDSARNGLLVEQGNTKVTKLKDGELSYSRESGVDSRESIQYNILSTPRGGQYQLTLPDGTRAWLNAASSIKYPTTFNDTERKVEITGEAYFEVSPLPISPDGGEAKGKLPFIVKVLNAQGVAAEVKVLGTHFNINAYTDEPTVTTTLLEGRVQVYTAENDKPQTTNYKLLTPGQQAQINGEDIKISTANTESAVAWVHGQFIFSSVDIKTLLRQASRWYNIDIEYQQVPAYKFSGTISRSVTLAEFLKILAYSEVKFIVQDRKLIIQ
jgi:transmembrane sensor